MWRRPVVTILLIVVAMILTLPMRAQQKPFTQEQVSNMVRDGLGDESGAKLIEQRGIDFAPAEDFLQSLKAAGASEAFLKALRAAKPPELASAKKPLNQNQIYELLVGQVSSRRVAMLVKERGIDFEPQLDYLDKVRRGGGDDELITALKTAKVTKPLTVDPAIQARQAQVQQHVEQGAELAKKGEYAEAEQEYRTALLLDPHNADLYDSVAFVLGQRKKWDDAESAAREAVRLDPNNEWGHGLLGVVLGKKGDWDGAIAEFREALRLNPNYEWVHVNLGSALAEKGDLDSAMKEFHAALRLNPNDDNAHDNLGATLGSKGDWDGDIQEEREALRLNPNNEEAHNNLGLALGRKGDWDGDIQEEREALRLNPNNKEAHNNLGFALYHRSNPDAAIGEFREALRLNPNDDWAHTGLGVALIDKRDPEGAIAEFGEAIRLNPKNDQAYIGLAGALDAKGDLDGGIAQLRQALRVDPSNGGEHAFLGFLLEEKGDQQGALQEYRAAYLLDPKNATFRQNYERLLQIGSPSPAAQPETARRGVSAPVAGTIREDPKDGLNYVWIQPGTFRMGCSPGDSECSVDETPSHQVKISKGFWIGQTPVTVGAYKRFNGVTGHQMPPAPSFDNGWPNDNMPMVNVSWDDAQAYCGWSGGRLPSEAEWEYAARGGSTAARYGLLDEVAWYRDNSGNQTHPVGQKRANGFGLFDMLGNVWEWVDDWLGTYSAKRSVDPSGPATQRRSLPGFPTLGDDRVQRGGSWSSFASQVRVSYRGSGRYPLPLQPQPAGFRCVGELGSP